MHKKKPKVVKYNSTRKTLKQLTNRVKQVNSNAPTTVATTISKGSKLLDQYDTNKQPNYNTKLPAKKLNYQAIFSKWSLDPLNLSSVEKGTTSKLENYPNNNNIGKLKQKRFNFAYKYHRIPKTANEFQHSDNIDSYIINYRKVKILKHLSSANKQNDFVTDDGIDSEKRKLVINLS
ncbi:unnamed protein product [Heterobilharzia americana]|nr:unnamed protein product [Heterobilharzia americana]